MHQVHTLNQLVRIGRAHWASCRGVRWVVSWPHPQPYCGKARPCRKPGRPCRRLYRDTPSTKAIHGASCRALSCVSQPQAPYHGAPWPCRSLYRSPWLHCIATERSPSSATILQLYRDTPLGQAMQARAAACPARRPTVSWLSDGRVVPVSRYNPAAKPPSCHDTIYCIATHSPYSQALARAPLALARGSTVSQVESSAVSWPTMCACYALCHDTVHCSVTKCKMGSSPAYCLHFVFFFTSFFFLLQLLENHPNFFSIKPNKFIKIYFIHFFSSFTHCKTLEKNFFTSFFFFI